MGPPHFPLKLGGGGMDELPFLPAGDFFSYVDGVLVRSFNFVLVQLT